jgi:hypothetical protein
MRRRALVVVIVLASTAAGCATGNTPAQDLAWARWRTCDRFATIGLDRIDPNGRLVVTGQQVEAAAFTACVRAAAADQVRRGATTVAEAPVLVKLFGCLGGAM